MCFKVIYRIPGVFLRKCLFVLIPILFLFSFFSAARSEEITVTTYYPSPNGSYDALLAKRFSVGDVNGDGSVNTSDISSTDGYLLVADKIGIGTTSPASNLTVYNGNESIGLTSFTQSLTNAGIQISTDYTGSAYTPGVFWQTSNNNTSRPKGGIWLFEDGNGTDMYFGTSNNYATGITNTALVIDQSGGVGIGSTYPYAKLHVIKTGNSVTTTSLTNDDLIVDDADAVVGIYSSNAGSWGSAISLGETNGGTFQDKWGIARLTSPYNSDLTFTYGTNVNYASNSRLMTLMSSGRLGIGTTSPSAKVEVNMSNSSGWSGLLEALRITAPDTRYWMDLYTYVAGGGNVGYLFRPRKEDGSTYSGLTIDTYGYVGIGTLTPTSNLHIYDNTVGDYTDNALKVETTYGYATFGSLNSSWFHISTSLPRFYFNNPCQANGGFSTYSSREKKKDIVHLSAPEEDEILESLSGMRMARFRYKDERFDKKVHLGIIAEESPDQLLTDSKKAIEIVDYISYAVTAIKAQQRQIKEQQSQIEELRKEIRALRSKVK